MKNLLILCLICEPWWLHVDGWCLQSFRRLNLQSDYLFELETPRQLNKIGSVKNLSSLSKRKQTDNYAWSYFRVVRRRHSSEIDLRNRSRDLPELKTIICKQTLTYCHVPVDQRNEITSRSYSNKTKRFKLNSFKRHRARKMNNLLILCLICESWWLYVDLCTVKENALLAIFSFQQIV